MSGLFSEWTRFTSDKIRESRGVSIGGDISPFIGKDGGAPNI